MRRLHGGNNRMAFENTITEQDMDAASRKFVHGFKDSSAGSAADLDVDGLSESLLARLIRLFSSSKA
jgi:hypothetical protein